MKSKPSKKPFVFVIMPFSKDFDDVYELGIKPVCVDAGARCERVDEQIFLENILERIYGQISKADIVVAEMTDRNANVFYEVGYAHGIGKPVILITNKADDIPFDLRLFPHIVHKGSIVTLKDRLEKKIRWCIERPKELIKAGHLDQELKRMSQHIRNYLKAHNFRMVSFETIRERINEDYSDKILLTLIDRSPDQFRRANIRGDRPGIALL